MSRIFTLAFIVLSILSVAIFCWIVLRPSFRNSNVPNMEDDTDASMVDVVHNHDDLVRLNNREATVIGRYKAVARPKRGQGHAPEDYAVIELRDGTMVYLESFHTAEAVRSDEERVRFNGRNVRVVGTVHEYMPNLTQGPLAPAVTEIKLISVDQER